MANSESELKFQQLARELQLRPPGHPRRDISLNNLAYAHRKRYEHSGAEADLEEAIRLYTEALETCASHNKYRDTYQNNLAFALHNRYWRNRAEADLTKAIELSREVLKLRHPGHLRRDATLNILSSALYDQSAQNMLAGDFEQAIQLGQEAVELCPPGHPTHNRSLNHLAHCFHFLYEKNGARDDLDKAIELTTKALQLCPPGHPCHDESLNNLAICLESRYEHSQVRNDLEKAIEFHTEALELRPPGHPARDMSLLNLAICLQSRYDCIGARDDLNKAIELNTEALQLRPPGHRHRDISLHHLANNLDHRYEYSRVKDDLDRAIECNTEALKLRCPGHPACDKSLYNLAYCLHHRYDHSGVKDDLDKAIEFNTEALKLRPPGHPGCGVSLNNLASCLRSRYEHNGVKDDLDRAIELNTEALKLHPPGHPNHNMSLHNLAACLRSYYDHSGARDDLDKAIELNTEALKLCPPGHPARDLPLNNLAACLQFRYEHSGVRDDFDKAIELNIEALKLRPSGHPLHAQSLYNYAGLLFKCLDKGSAIALLQEGSQDYLSQLPHTLGCANQLMKVSKSGDGNWFQGYSNFIDLIEHHIAIESTMKQQYTILASQRSFIPLPMDAAALALSSNNVEEAVKWLDAGRSLLWSQSQHFHEPLPSSLPPDHTLRERFTLTCSELQSLGNAIKEHSIARKKELLKKFQGIVKDIQNTPGCQDFLKPLPFSKLQQAAKEGPVIIINCSKDHGCHVIIVLENEAPISYKLDESFWQDAHDIYKEYIDARQKAKDSKSPKVLGWTLSNSTCQWLWKAIVCDVVKHLQKWEVSIGSRIWWCPTSFLTTLPFHAAGKNGKKGEKGEFLMDYYISSYTSTLKALIDARNLPVAAIQQHQILVVAQPSDHNLPSAQNELDTVCGCICDHSLKQVQLVDQGATNITVKNTLKSCSWAHFICHGEISATSPFDSSLHLFEGDRLSLNDIITAHLPDAQFAFLAACHSAEQIVSGPDAPEVVLHLASAMQFSGFRSVIGTLWEMRDEDGPYVAKRFYEKMLEGQDHPEMRYKKAAGALASVIQQMREQKVMNEKTGKKEKMGMDRWVNYVHIGA
ncbi:hypothetical protein EYR40_010442 [Pleurotus pulmonarius]|nr:hypothetical protein EYR36_010170 [Pleurotus pulmonarius]KAF4588887.1 hypothetical protein EYR40_010442 [Pleurotus pulmonarius]